MAFADLAADGVITDYGDLYYILGIRKILHSRKTLTRVVRAVAPIAAQLPFALLYPSGGSDTTHPQSNGFADYLYRSYDIIAGDYKYIAKYMPEGLDGTWVVTNTTTAADIDFLRTRGVSKLITTTHRLAGRSFGTNVMEALLVASTGQTSALDSEHYLRLLAENNLRPSVQDL
jgi:hypothetical protein